MGDLSEHFSRAELACPCCGRCELDPGLVPALEQLRTAAAEPVIIHSGFRCARHNAAVGGQPDSRHLLGQAADWTIAGRSLAELYGLAAAIEAFGGIGIYDEGFAHCDVRPHTPGGRPALWARVKGRYTDIGALVAPEGLTADRP